MTPRDRWTCVAALGVILMAAFLGVRQLRTGPPMNRLLHRGVGEILARETARAVGPQGSVVVVTASAEVSAALELELEAFIAGLSRSAPGLRVQKVVRLELRPGADMGPGFGISGGRFLRLLQRYAEARAVVSLVGIPTLEPSEVLEIGAGGPAVVALCRSHRKMAPLLRSPWLRAVLVPRFEFPAPGPEHPATPAEWVDHQFQLVTPESHRVLSEGDEQRPGG